MSEPLSADENIDKAESGVVGRGLRQNRNASGRPRRIKLVNEVPAAVSEHIEFIGLERLTGQRRYADFPAIPERST